MTIEQFTSSERYDDLHKATQVCMQIHIHEYLQGDVMANALPNPGAIALFK